MAPPADPSGAGQPPPGPYTPPPPTGPPQPDHGPPAPWTPQPWTAQPWTAQPPPYGQQPYGGPYRTWPTVPYRDRRGGNRVAATAAALALSSAVVLQWFVVHAVQHQRDVLHQVLNGAGSISDVQAADNTVRAVNAATVLVTLAVAAVFITWLYRMRTDAGVFHAELMRRDRGWAIGGWFIPFANFVIPYLVISDVTSAFRTPLEDRWGTRRTDPIVVMWWVVWIVSGIAIRVVALNTPTTVSGFDSHVHAEILCSAGLTLAGVLGVAVVVTLTAAGNRQWQRLLAAPPR